MEQSPTKALALNDVIGNPKALPLFCSTLVPSQVLIIQPKVPSLLLTDSSPLAATYSKVLRLISLFPVVLHYDPDHFRVTLLL